MTALSSKILSFAPLVPRLFLIGSLLYALLGNSEFANSLSDSAMYMFLTELFTLIAIMVFSTKGNKASGIFITIAYAGFIALFCIGTGSFYPAVYFIIRVVSGLLNGEHEISITEHLKELALFLVVTLGIIWLRDTFSITFLRAGIESYTAANVPEQEKNYYLVILIVYAIVQIFYEKLTQSRVVAKSAKR